MVNNSKKTIEFESDNRKNLLEFEKNVNRERISNKDLVFLCFS